MYYKRNEPFRYTFGQPLQATIETFNKEEQELTSNGKYEALLLDLSPNGMKVVSSIDIETKKITHVRTSFTLNETKFELNGEIIWKKRLLGQDFEYGITGSNPQQIKNVLITELKLYSKKHAQK